MREKKWTPGPWESIDHGVGEVMVYLRREDPDKEHCVCSLMDDDDFCSWPDGYSTSEEAMANARLIAAAPDLVEALEGLARMHRERFGLDGAYDTEIRVAEAALAKAYGETNHD